MKTDAETRALILKALDDARTFDELRMLLALDVGAPNRPVHEGAKRFIEHADASGLDDTLRERFAQVLSRFVESTRALELAGVLENGEP